MSKWTDLINRHNPNEDDLCDLLDEAEKIGRKNAIEEYFEKLQSVAFGSRKGLVHFKDIVAIREQLKERE